MVADAKFWVVEPRVTLSGVSGLGTLLSGNFIGFRGRQIGQAATQVHRTRGAADHHRRPAGPAVCAQGQRPGVVGDRLADLLPPPAGGPGHRVRPVERWQGRWTSRSSSTRLTTSTSTRARASGTRADSTSRVGAGGVDVRTQSLVARARGRRRVRHAVLRPHQGRARSCQYHLYPLQ